MTKTPKVVVSFSEFVNIKFTNYSKLNSTVKKIALFIPFILNLLIIPFEYACHKLVNWTTEKDLIKTQLQSTEEMMQKGACQKKSKEELVSIVYEQLPYIDDLLDNAKQEINTLENLGLDIYKSIKKSLNNLSQIMTNLEQIKKNFDQANEIGLVKMFSPGDISFNLSSISIIKKEYNYWKQFSSDI